MTDAPAATGGCLCGAVRYALRGPLREVVYCHCEQCRRTSGHYVAATDAALECVEIESDETLAWYASSAEAERGFCRICGSNLFWRPADGSRMSIMAGTLDSPTGLTAREHIFVADAGDYYSIDDGLPRHEQYYPDK